LYIDQPTVIQDKNIGHALVPVANFDGRDYPPDGIKGKSSSTR